MPSPQRIIDTVVLSTLGLWLLRSLRWLGNTTLMRHGFIEVRVHGLGVDTTCRADAYYRYAGLFNPNTTGWIISHGWAQDDPSWRSSEYSPEPWCGVVLRTERKPTTGATFRVGLRPESAEFLNAIVTEAARPYGGVAKAGVRHVEEASRSRVRGTFHLTLEHLAREPAAPPLTAEGRFEVSRRRLRKP